MEHECKYRQRLEWSGWTREGSRRWREARRIPRCELCGKVRASRRPRRAVRLEVEAVSSSPPSVMEPAARRFAGKLHARAMEQGEGSDGIGMKGLLSWAGVPASRAEDWLEEFLAAGWVRLRYALKGTSRLLSEIVVIDLEKLESFALPGLREARGTAIEEAKAELADIEHPVADQVMQVLSGSESDRLDPDLVRALAAAARFAESGDVCSDRVFSSRYLGDSKAILRLRNRMEQVLGPLESLGIREGAALLLVGGAGAFNLEGQTLALDRLRPCVGLSRECVLGRAGIDFPAGGLLIVENLAAFEACCLGEVTGSGDCLIAWSAGFPGRAVRAVVEEAARKGSPVRVWADIDLNGVRIARLIHRWASDKAVPWRMSPEDLVASKVALPLSSKAETAIRHDINVHPHALLRETLEAILERGRWVEQEALLASRNRKETSWK